MAGLFSAFRRLADNEPIAPSRNRGPAVPPRSENPEMGHPVLLILPLGDLRHPPTIPGPQKRGTGGTLSVVWKGHRDRGHRPPSVGLEMDYGTGATRHLGHPPAFQNLVTEQQPQVAPQLRTRGDVSCLNPMPKAARSSGCWSRRERQGRRQLHDNLHRISPGA